MIVDLLPNDDQAMVLDSVRAILGAELPVERLRDEAAFQGRAEGRIWSALAQLGVFGLGLAEDEGGVGYGVAEEVLAAREFGRYLISPDVLATMLAAHLADAPDRETLVAGDLRAVLAAPAGDGSLQIFDGETSERVVTPRALESLADIGVLEDRSGLDETVRLRRTGDRGAHATPASDHTRRARLLFCSYLAGIAEAARDITVAYVKIREQFGQPIGAFQAVKHLCADMALRAEAATAQTFFAALAFEAGTDERDAEIDAASLVTVEAALENSRTAIQLHGGMGFTYECDAHFYLKRAHVMSSILMRWA